jgi:chromatin remodeling complex protein RSC6
MHPAHPLLATFMGVDEGAPVSRVQALKAISTYVREHELQVQENRRTFYCKGDLHNLFPDRETMGYTDIMREIKPFFPAKQATN